jgi:pimeloyl-ACP methyl ester carboxylesterase
MTTRRSILTGALAVAATAMGPPPLLIGRAQADVPAPAQQSGATRTLRTDSTIKSADGREVRISQWSAWGQRRGTVLFSHGALSAPEKYERVIGPWNAAGFEVRAPLHVDSIDHPDHARYGMLDSWRARLQDMQALANLLDVPSFVAAGHSYGALVALTLGGAAAEVPIGLAAPLRDPRASAVVAFSPPGPTAGLVTSQGYGALAVPAFIQTGDRDVPYGSKEGRWQVHLAAYDAARPGDKFALVLEGVDHYFGGLICNFDVPGPTQDAQLGAAVALSSLFIDAFAAGEKSAQLLLNQALAQSGVARLSRK